MFNRKMQKTISFCISVLMSISLVVPMAQAVTFSDASGAGAEFAQYINDLGTRGVVTGVDGQFFPWNNVTRGEVAKIVVLAAGLPIITSTAETFPDVPSSNGFFRYIQTAAQLGVVNGYPDGTFKPSNPVTRAELAKMITGAFGMDMNPAGGPHFPDVPPAHSLYMYVETARNAGIVSGFLDGLYHPDDMVIRAHVAKMVSKSIQAMGAVKRFAFEYYDTSFPSGVAERSRGTTVLKLTTNKLPMLSSSEGYLYHMWVIQGQNMDQILDGGSFNLDSEGKFVDSRGQHRSDDFTFSSKVEEGAMVAISVEPKLNNTGTPQGSLLLSGILVGDAANLLFPETIAGATGVVIVRGASHKDITLEFMNLVDMSSEGLQYAAWAMAPEGPVLLGMFQGKGPGITRAHTVYEVGGDFLTDVSTVKVTVETTPDFSPDPSPIMPFMAVIGGSGTAGDQTDDDTTTVDIDPDMYKGLTTHQTDVSIIQRTAMEMDCGDSGEDVIVQAYASAPEVALSSDVGIVVKVSTCDGVPIPDLSLTMNQVSGLEGDEEDPREIGRQSGVYIGTWTAPSQGEVGGSDRTVEIEISQGTGDDVTIPNVTLSFELATTSNVGSAKKLEVDVTRDDITIDKNETDPTLSDENQDAIVIITALDGSGRNIEDIRNDIKLSASSNDLDGKNPSKNEGNAYIYEVNVDDILGDTDEDTNQFSAKDTFRVEAVDSSSSIEFLPIFRPDDTDSLDDYEVLVTFIPEDTSD